MGTVTTYVSNFAEKVDKRGHIRPNTLDRLCKSSKSKYVIKSLHIYEFKSLNDLQYGIINFTNKLVQNQIIKILF